MIKDVGLEAEKVKQIQILEKMKKNPTKKKEVEWTPVKKDDKNFIRLKFEEGVNQMSGTLRDTQQQSSSDKVEKLLNRDAQLGNLGEEIIA